MRGPACALGPEEAALRASRERAGAHRGAWPLPGAGGRRVTPAAPRRCRGVPGAG